MAGAEAIRRVGVIGAGTIGASWAAQFLARGLEVTVSDPAPDGADRVARMIDGAWPVLAELGLAPGADPGRWRFAADPAEAASGSDFVQESAPERDAVKTELLARIDAALPPEVVIATSTSGLKVSEISRLCRHPERVVTGHPFNPPHLVPLVEVVGGRFASPIEIAREVPGHLANRLQAALLREAIHLVAEGVASVADVDAAITEGPGLRWALMGPHATFHLAGGEGGMAHALDHLMPAMQGWWRDLGAPEMTEAVGAALIAGVAEETGGRSTAGAEGGVNLALRAMFRLRASETGRDARRRRIRGFRR
jgi:carnitine 3-dehydrogenase